MASFKRLKRSDVISVPYVANKNWIFNYCPYPKNDQYITIYKGTNITGSFSPITDPITEGQYERLVYSQINHLFYQQYSSSAELLNTSSLASSLYYESSSQLRATDAFYDFNENPSLIKNYPTGANASIRVLSINQDLYGQKILPHAFELSSSVYCIKDDGIGNLIDTKNSNTYVGNIFYPQGLSIITHPDYQLLFPLPPLATQREVIFYDTDTNRNINLTGSIITRGSNLVTESLALSNFESSFFTKNNNGTVDFTGSAALGIYQTNFTFNTNLTGSSCADTSLTSNLGLLKVNLLNNCNFAVSSSEISDQ
jgi:hypothetical protein